MTRRETELGVYETRNVAATTGQQTVTMKIGDGLFELFTASIYSACTAAAPGTIYIQYPNAVGGNDEQYLVSGTFTEKLPLCLRAPTKVVGPANLIAYYEVPVSATSKFTAGWRRIYQ